MEQKSNKLLILLLIFLVSFSVLAQNLDILSFEFRSDEVQHFRTSRLLEESARILFPAGQLNPQENNPVFFYWFILLFYKIFGVEWANARLFSAFTGSLTVVLTWLISWKMFRNGNIALLSAIVMFSGKIFYRHSRVITPDILLHIFIVLSLYFAYRYLKDPTSKKNAFLFFIFAGFGFMSGGLPGLAVPLAIFLIYAALSGNAKILFAPLSILGLEFLIIMVSLWIVYMKSLLGPSYASHLFFDKDFMETIDLVGSQGWTAFLPAITHNFLRSLQHFVLYGLPWMPFLFLAIPLSIARIKNNDQKKDSLLFLNVWFFTVFSFYSIFTEFLQPRILLLTVPLSVLTGYFFLENFTVSKPVRPIIHFFKKYLMAIALTLGIFLISFVYFLLAEANKIFVPFVVLLYIWMVVSIHKTKNVMLTPILFSFMLIVNFSQAPLLERVGLIPQSTISRMVETVRKDYNDDTLIATGRHGVPDKIVQSFFDRNITTQDNSDPAKEESDLDQVLSHKGTVYYFMMEKDYDRLIKNKREGLVKVIRRDDIVRRKVYINGGFFLGLITLDAPKVRSYLLEKILLLKKEPPGFSSAAN